MWRTPRQRLDSALVRLALADTLWGWRPHAGQRPLLCCPAQVRVAACGRRWGKTECLAVDLATLALAEAAAGRPCRQLVVAPTDAQARLIGAEVQARLEAALAAPHPQTAGLSLAVRRQPALRLTLTPNPPPCFAGSSRSGRMRRSASVTEAPPPPGPRTPPSGSASAGGNTEIVFQTAGRDGRGLRGLWAHRIVVDEAGYVPDAVLTEVLLPMLTDVGGELLLASSPAGRRNVFYRLFTKGCSRTGFEAGEGEEAAPADTPVSPPVQHLSPPVQHLSPPAQHFSPPVQHLSCLTRNGGGGEGRAGGGSGAGGGPLSFASFQCASTDNPHLDGAYLTAMAEELGESAFAAEYLAQFVDDYGAVFRADDIAGCLADDDRVRLDGGDLVSAPQPGRWYSVGVDWGRKLDFTVVAVLDGTTRPARLVGLWRWQGMGWEAQAARVGAVIASFLPLRVLADGNSIGDPVAEQLQKYVGDHLTGGGRVPQIERFLFGAESKTRLVDRLTFGLSARSLTFPPHRALLSELRAFEYGASLSAGRPRMAAAGGGHDDTVIALALAWYCAPEGPPASPGSLLLLGSSLGLGGRGPR